MAESHVIHALVRKRAELSGEVAELKRQIRSIDEQIKHVDACLALFGYQHHPKGIKPVRPRPEPMFKQGQLKRMVLDIRRETGRPMLNRDIAVDVIRRMGWTQTDELLTAITAKVKDVTKRLPNG
jgi:hypothetical protein